MPSIYPISEVVWIGRLKVVTDGEETNIKLFLDQKSEKTKINFALLQDKKILCQSLNWCLHCVERFQQKYQDNKDWLEITTTKELKGNNLCPV